MLMPRNANLVAASVLSITLATACGAAAATTSIQSAKPIIASSPDLVCQVATSGNYVHIEALNKGGSTLPAGTLFHFVIVGPTKKTTETKTLKADLAAGKAVNVTNAIKASSVVSCTPAA